MARSFIVETSIQVEDSSLINGNQASVRESKFQYIAVAAIAISQVYMQTPARIEMYMEGAGNRGKPSDAGSLYC